MSEENEQKDDEQQEAVAETAEATDEEASAETEDTEKVALKRQLKQAEYVIEKLKRERKQAPEASEEVDEEQVRAKVVQELSVDFIDAALERATKDPIERERIRLEYEQTIIKTGHTRTAIEADVAKAVRLVRADHIEKSAREKRLAKDVKSTVENLGGASNQERPAEGEDWKRYFKKADLEYMKANNWPEEKMKRAAMAIKASL